MGNIIAGKLRNPISFARGSLTEIITGRKRKREHLDDSCDDISDALEKSLHVPKKKKLLSTTQYIYQALFKEEKNSDVSVAALGKVWNLHKVYLCQSPYFASMFSGAWRESSQDFINIRILDSKITLESLEVVFGSLYIDEVVIEPVFVTSVLATATLFQLDSLIDRCTEVMIETTNAETAVAYYEAACQYGVQNVKSNAFNWLLTNLLSFFFKRVKWLRLIEIDLMTDLVASHDLFVMQTEFSLYSLLRMWVFLKLYPNFIDKTSMPPELRELMPQTYFKDRVNKTSFLQTPEGCRFEKPFRALRIQYLINHHVDLRLVLDDNIIPKEWLHNHLLTHWNSILKIDHTLEMGPDQIDEKVFYKSCMRCGRVLQEPGYQKWRWTGFNFGLDLVLIMDKRVLSIKRHHRAEHERLLSLQTKRKFLIRVTIASMTEQRQQAHSQTTGIQSLTLEKNEEINLMLIDRELDHPLLLSVNLLVVSPDMNILGGVDIVSRGGNAITSTGALNQTPIWEIGANNDENSSASSSTNLPTTSRLVL